MPAFRYEAVNATGLTSKGVLRADSPRAARSDLRARGLVPLVLELIGNEAASGERRTFRFGEKLSNVELALFTRQLAALLGSNLPMEQAFDALMEQAERPYLRELIAAIRADLMGGASFSDALANHPRDFADIYRALVSSGEQTGQLAKVLSQLADYIERRNALVQKLRLAFTYPAIVTVVAFLIVIFLLTYVVPQIVSVFASTKQQLPLLTTIMLALSGFVRHWGWLVALIVVVGWLLWQRSLRDPERKLRWHRWLLRAPMMGRFQRSLNTSRFASTLAITTSAGVPILRALHTSRDTLSNMAMRQQVDEATNAVREGVSLARALGEQQHFPPMLIHMIRAGEATGELPAMLERAAQMQAQDLERRALTIAGLLEPMLILTMGVVVLLIVLAVLMPIIEINQLVR
ncbi:MAG: type II secretion system inner membrane protein GspF [Burkholderiaceae bacterium]